MSKIFLVVIVFVLSACASSAAASSAAPNPIASAAPTIAATAIPTVTLTPAPSVAATAAPTGAVTPASSPGPSTACLDAGQLADSADTVLSALQAMVAALKTPDIAQASSYAGAAATGMRSVATLVTAVTPDAAKDLRATADKLDKAKATFPGDGTAVRDAQAAWDRDLQLARDRICLT